jgi:hypothetical protein
VFGARIAQLGTFLNSSTVIGDGLRDTLYGSSGRDWLLDYEHPGCVLGVQLEPHDGRQEELTLLLLVHAETVLFPDRHED